MSDALSEHRPAPAVEAPGASSPPANRVWVRALRVGLLAVTDFLSLFAAGATGYLLWARPVRGQPAELYLGLAPLLALFLAGYAQAGLYPGFGLGPVETLRRLSRVTAFGFLVLAAISFAVKLPHLYSRVTFVIAFALALAAVPVGRWLVATVAGRWPRWRVPVVVIGEPGTDGRLDVLRDLERLGYRPAARVSSQDAQALTAGGRSAEGAAGGPAATDRTELPEWARSGVRIAIVTSPGRTTRDLLAGLQQHFRHVITLHGLDELPVEGVQIRNLGRVLGIEYTNNLLLRRSRSIKRAADLALGSVALVAAAPVIALAALAAKLASPGPAFFVQEREGLGGRRIRVYKVRTMYADAERRLDEHLARHPTLQREWEEHYKLRDDPRLVPGVGAFLRRFSLDELPQLAGVVVGTMSLVGPRPFPDYHLARFPVDFRHLRQRVRPGITGLWQVTVRSGGTVAEQQAYDTHYIRNWSLWLDLYVLVRTLGAVISGRGAY